MVLTIPTNLLRETLDMDCDEIRENERIPTPVRMFGVCLHSIGLSVREVVAVLALLGVDRSHGAVWNWTQTFGGSEHPPTSTRVALSCGLLERKALQRSANR